MHSIETVSSNGDESKNTLKREIDDYTFRQLLLQFAGDLNTEQDTELPKTEEEFISYVDDYCSSMGGKILADKSNGIKVKIEIADKDKYANYLKEENSLKGYDIEIDNYFVCVVFDKDNNFKALKNILDIRANSQKESIHSMAEIEMKTSSGNLEIPSDFSEYTPIQ
jgi:hypothetical protein